MPKSVFLSRPPKKVPCKPCGPGMLPANLPSGAKDIHRLARRNIDAALLIDGRTVAAVTALQSAELALIGQRAVRLYVEREEHCAVRDVERLFIRT